MKIKELLADPAKWTQRTMARDKSGCPIAACSNKAQCWCLAGAVIKCYPPNEVDQIRKRIATAIKQEGYFYVTEFNDAEETTHADIVKLVNKLDI